MADEYIGHFLYPNKIGQYTVTEGWYRQYTRCTIQMAACMLSFTLTGPSVLAQAHARGTCTHITSRVPAIIHTCMRARSQSITRTWIDRFYILNTGEPRLRTLKTDNNETKLITLCRCTIILCSMRAGAHLTKLPFLSPRCQPP